MPPPKAPISPPAEASSHLRGAARLAVEGTAGIVALVEAVHARIARVPGYSTPAAADGRTRGITGLVYRSIHGVTRLVGGSVDALLALLEPALQASPPSAERDAVLAALNGVLGDHLETTRNPLAVRMRWRRDGLPLMADTPTGPCLLDPAAAGPRVLVLLHGLCMNDRQWLRKGHDHGAALARDHGWTPVYLHYNSGRSIAANGRDLAQALHELLAAWPVPLQRLALIGHSMGGLLARSALHQAAQQGLGWPARVDDLVCLGTPHHGAPLERAGHGVDLLLDAAPYASPFARLGRLRSAGITDLRHGNLLGPGPAGLPPHVPLPTGLRCWAIAGRLGGSLKPRLLGDGLVPLDSAFGRSPDPARTLAFPPERLWVAEGTGHLDLLDSRAVHARLGRILGTDEPGQPGNSMPSAAITCASARSNSKRA